MTTQIVDFKLAHVALAKAFYQKLNEILATHGDDLAKALCHKRSNDVAKFCATVAQLATEPFTDNADWQNLEYSDHTISATVAFYAGNGYERVFVRITPSLLGESDESRAELGKWVSEVITHYHEQMKKKARGLCQQRRDVASAIKSLEPHLQEIAMGKKTTKAPTV